MPEPVLAPWTSVSATLAAARALDDQQLVDEISDLAVQMRALQARQAGAITELSDRIDALGYALGGASETIAVTLAVSSRSADNLLGHSVQLCDREVVWAALAEGRIDWTKAQHIIDLLKGIPDPRREELELVALDFAATHTPHQLRRRLLELTCTPDPDIDLRKKALKRRGVSIFPAGHGMADVCAYLSMEQAEAFIQALDSLAEAADCPDPHAEGDARTPEQRRADALVGFLNAHCTWDISVDVIISADTLIGDNDHCADSRRLGPIGSELARQLAWSPDARWRRLVTDPLTGSLIDLSAQTYRIPTRIKNAVKARDVSCRFPGCHQPAKFFDCDHIVPWPKGRTELSNLAGLCRRHHRVKTHSAWRVQRDPESPHHDLIWTSPLGTRHTTSAHQYHRRD